MICNDPSVAEIFFTNARSSIGGSGYSGAFWLIRGTEDEIFQFSLGGGRRKGVN